MMRRLLYADTASGVRSGHGRFGSSTVLTGVGGPPGAIVGSLTLDPKWATPEATSDQKNRGLATPHEAPRVSTKAVMILVSVPRGPDVPPERAHHDE